MTLKGGSSFSQKVGTRAQVWHGTAYKTGYGNKGLTKADLMMKKGRIVSRKASKSAHKNKNLGRYVDIARKNKGKKGFVAMRKNMVVKTAKRKSKRSAGKTRRRRRKGRKCRNSRGRYKKC